MTTYRIVPGWLSPFELQKRCLFFFWSHVTVSNSYSHLAAVVAQTGGVLANAQPIPDKRGEE